MKEGEKEQRVLDLENHCSPLLRWMLQSHSEGESCSVMSDSVTPWTVAHQAPLSMGFSRTEKTLVWSAISFFRGSS